MERWVRPPVVAGSWYPGEASELADAVDGYLGAVRPVDGKPIALIVPHAGYVFSGPVAAYGFKQLQGHDYEVAVVIASDHAPPISRCVSVWAKGGLATPLGVVPVHEEVAQTLVEFNARIEFDPASHDGEHPIEIELPFLQRSVPGCRVVPILMGVGDRASIEMLAQGLVTALRGRKAVIIASSDLSHYPPLEQATKVDWVTLGAIETGDQEQVHSAIEQTMASGVPGLSTCACGEAAIRVALLAASKLGADSYRVLHYANSGDSPFGERSRVVGYGAAMAWRHEPPVLSSQARSALLSIARRSIMAEVAGREPVPARQDEPVLNRLLPAFVTVKIHGALRGCIGYLRYDTPLQQVVHEKAASAATSDPRFPPLTEAELAELSLSISVLSPLRRVADPESIQIGTHGIAIRHQGRQGVLLPQVAVERNWDRMTFLDHLCLKAGLPEGSWSAGAALYTFTTLEVGESEAH